MGDDLAHSPHGQHDNVWVDVVESTDVRRHSGVRDEMEMRREGKKGGEEGRKDEGRGDAGGCDAENQASAQAPLYVLLVDAS